MQFLRNNLPNLLTCLNLLCGLSGLILMAEYGIQAMPMLCILVFLAGVADFFDGFLARMLGSVSAIGKDLDSLADSVTFGVLPGMAAYFSLKEAGAGDLAWLALSIPLFSVIRLARFNNDPGQSDSFTGVPTPANAFFILFFFDSYFFGEGFLAQLQLEAELLISLVMLSSLLLISPFKIIALKFKGSGLKANLEKYILVVTGILCIIIFKKEAVPLIFGIYLLLSFVFAFLKADKKASINA
jgi:CDP-diacylglycerol--serine O-phosphatidyltransferase